MNHTLGRMTRPERVSLPTWAVYPAHLRAQRAIEPHLLFYSFPFIPRETNSRLWPVVLAPAARLLCLPWPISQYSNAVLLTLWRGVALPVEQGTCTGLYSVVVVLTQRTAWI